MSNFLFIFYKIASKKEIIQSLEAKVLILQHQYKEKSDQVETFEHLIDQLTGELHSSKDDVKLNKEQRQQYEQQVETLKEKAERLQKQVQNCVTCIKMFRLLLFLYYVIYLFFFLNLFLGC